MNRLKGTTGTPSAIAKMGRPLLVAAWTAQFGSPPDPRLRVELLRPALIYRVQEQAAGLSTKGVESRMKNISSVYSVGQFRAGTRIVRQWKGQIHEVAVTDDGYEYRGEKFKSLSPIATLITGTKWSGPAFFGTKPKVRSK